MVETDDIENRFIRKGKKGIESLSRAAKCRVKSITSVPTERVVVRQEKREPAELASPEERDFSHSCPKSRDSRYTVTL